MAARKLKVSTTGYKENSKDKNLDRLYVPSPNLTMTNVKKHVKATPVYPNDMYGNPITMIPGVASYTFPGAVGVIEEKLPEAQTGLPSDYESFLKYSETAPDNRRPDSEWQYGNPRQYDHYGMWDALGKPKNFDEALTNYPQWQPDEYDGMYHGFSTNPNTGVWLKSHIPGESHPGDTGWMEYQGFMLSNDRNWGPKTQNLVYDTDLQRMRYVDRQQGGPSHRMQTEGEVSREEKIKKDTERMAYNAAAQTSANWDPQGLNGAPEEPLEYDKKTGKYYRRYYDKASGQWVRQEVVLDIKPKSYGVPAKNAPKKTKEQVEKENAVKYSQKAKNDPTLWLAEHPEFMLDADGNPVLKSSMEANAPADYLTEQQKALKEEFIRERNAEPLQQSLGTLDNNPQTAAAATRYANTELAGPILEKNPRDKYATRAEWIESFTPQEKAIIEGSNKAYHFDPNTWTTFSRALQTEGNKNTQWQRNLDLTEEEKNRQITAMDRLGVLSPLMLPAQGVQRVLTEPFSTKNFLTGVVLNNWYNGDTPKPYYGDDGTMRDYYQPDAQAMGNLLYQGIFDPLNYISFGAGGIGTELAGDLSKLDNPLANLYKYNPFATKLDDVAGKIVGEGKGAFIADPARNYTAFKLKPNFLTGYREVKDASTLNWSPLIDRIKTDAQAKMLENFVTLTGGKMDDLDLAQFIDYYKAENNRFITQYGLGQDLGDIYRAKIKGSIVDSRERFQQAPQIGRDEALKLRTSLEETHLPQEGSPLGPRLGGGAEGSVYELASDPNFVIKVGQTFKTDNVDDLLKSFEGILGDNIAVVKRAHKDGSGLIEIMPNLNRTGKFKNLTKSEVLDKLEADARDLMSRGFFLDIDNLSGNFRYNSNKNVVDIYDVSKPAHGISYQDPEFVIAHLKDYFDKKIPDKPHPSYRPNSAVSKPIVQLTGAEATKRLDAARKEFASLVGKGYENLTPDELLDLFYLEHELMTLGNSVKKLGGTAKPRDHKSLDNYFEAAWTNSRKTN